MRINEKCSENEDGAFLSILARLLLVLFKYRIFTGHSGNRKIVPFWLACFILRSIFVNIEYNE